MKLILYGVMFFMISACSTTEHSVDELEYVADSPVYNVVLKVTQTWDYCGGVRPPKKMMEEFNTPKPLPYEDIYLRVGKVNDFENKTAYVAKSDSNGLIRMRLPEGSYSLVFNHKKDTDRYKVWIKEFGKETGTYSAIDPECLTKWFKIPDQVIEVTNEGSNHFSMNRNTPCEWGSVPCAKYLLDVPPMATPGRE